MDRLIWLPSGMVGRVEELMQSLHRPGKLAGSSLDSVSSGLRDFLCLFTKHLHFLTVNVDHHRIFYRAAEKMHRRDLGNR